MYLNKHLNTKKILKKISIEDEPLMQFSLILLLQIFHYYLFILFFRQTRLLAILHNFL